MRPPPLKLLTTLIVVVPIVAVSAALATIARLTSHHIAENLGNELVAGANARVAGEVRAYLGGAMRLSDAYAHRLAHGDLPTSGLAAWERPMLADLGANPDVASICFGNPAGDAIWLLRAHGRLEVGRADGARGGEAVEHVMRPDGSYDRASPIRTYRYDPRVRPWYQAALGSADPIWTPAYFWFNDRGAESETGTGYTRAIRSAASGGDGIAGVLVVDVTLSSISRFLRMLPLPEGGHVFIVDDQDLLIAASAGAVNSDQGQRLRLGESESPVARELASRYPPGSTGEWKQRVHLAGGEPARAHVTPLRPFPGINWRVIAVVPESSFLAEAQRAQRQSVLMALLAIGGGVALALLMSRRLSQPVLRLGAHVRGIGSGDFESRLHLDGAREFTELSRELNRMSAGLKQRMELENSMRLAMHVQQSLLPHGPPCIEGLDVAGQSRYCDATGGDYYDFMDVAQVPGGTLVAIGDVMGHGIGAALLMATARAAVRASVATQPSLGHVMSAVNTVLTRDANHGMFMTMTLLVIDPARRRARWACAGHDPIIVYDPHRDAFRELAEGDLPLGVDETAQYQQYGDDDLPAGAILVAGTDGIWEACNPAGEMYGKPRLRELVRTHASNGAAQMAQALEQDLRDFVGSAPVKDDVTFVILKLAPNPVAPVEAGPTAQIKPSD